MATTFAAVVMVDELAPVDRCTSNLVSLLELSCQETSIWLTETATAFVFDGADSCGPPAARRAAGGTGGSSMRWPSHATSRTATVSLTATTAAWARMNTPG